MIPSDLWPVPDCAGQLPHDISVRLLCHNSPRKILTTRLWSRWHCMRIANLQPVCQNKAWCNIELCTRPKTRLNAIEQLERLHSDIPPTAQWLPIPVIHIRSQVKRRQSQSYKFKKNAKNSTFEIMQETLHVTHPMKLLDKMCKYEMDPTRTVGATEWTRDVGQTNGRTDGSETNIPPYNFVVQGVSLCSRPKRK